MNSLSSNYGSHIGGLRQFTDIYQESVYSLFQEYLKAEGALDEVADFFAPLQSSYKQRVGLNKGRYFLFKTPADLEHPTTVWVEGITSCPAKMEVDIVSSKEVQNLYLDEFTTPSVEWEWTFGVLEPSGLRVYVTDFEVRNLELDYYKKVPPISIEGFILDNGQPSTNIDPIYDGRMLEKILDRMVLLALRNVGDNRAAAFR